MNLPFTVQADDRDVDPGFGEGGKVVTDFFGGDDAVVAIVLQRDGKIVAAGVACHKEGDKETADFALARYNVDGSLDSTFGKGGKVTTDLFGKSGSANAVTIAPDGRIVAAGAAASSSKDEENRLDFALVRYNIDGSLDASFGADRREFSIETRRLPTASLTAAAVLNRKNAVTGRRSRERF